MVTEFVKHVVQDTTDDGLFDEQRMHQFYVARCFRLK